MQKLRTDDKKPSPYDTASCLSYCLYHWLTPLITLGAKQPLELEDVYNVPQALRTNILYDLFQSLWDEEQTKHPKSGAKNLGWLLIRSSQRHLILSAMLLCVMAIVTIVQPYFLVKILDYVAHEDVNFLGMTSGVSLAVALAVISLMGSLGGNIAFTYVTEYGCRTRSMLIAKIFAKSLNISSFTRSKQTTGEIVTLMASDTERLWMFIMSSHWLWLAPIMLVVAMILLIVEFGFAGVIVTAVVILWYAVFDKSSGLVGYYRSKIVKLTGERVKLMNEALQGIRVIKLYSWETPTIERIEQIRNEETDLMMRYQLTKMFNTVLQFVSPVIISSSLFIAVYMLGEDSLSVSKVYHGLSLLNIIRLPLIILPIALAAYKEALKSYQRIQAYLDAPEAKTLLLTDVVDNILVDIRHASFSWEEHSTAEETTNPLALDYSLVNGEGEGDKVEVEKANPTTVATVVLRDVNLTIRRGEFIALVGEVGSGKTSLISALLGQLTLLKGAQTLSAKTAYVSQESWIQNITLQNNILFRSPMDHQRYVEVLDASQLSQDLLTLPNADATEIGERGINLSGGQKARVNIARALYAPNIDLYVFDDPLAAVDVHVGKELFQHAFKEMLHDKARVLSLSSNYQFLAHFDKIVVVLGGTITTCNSYAELKEKFPQFTSADGEKSFDDAATAELAGRSCPSTVQEECEAAHCTSIEEVMEQVDLLEVDIETSRDIDVELCEDEGKKVCDDNPGVEMTSPSVSRLSAVRRAKKGHSIYLQMRESILTKQESGKVLTTAEDRETGAVTFTTYTDYFAFATTGASNPRLAGARTLAIMFLLFIIAQTARVYSDLWPGMWAADHEQDSADMKSKTWFAWYLVLLAITVGFSYARAFHLVVACVNANISLHKSLVGKVFAAPVNTYFDITPLGRILNRFSKDLDMLDSMLPDFFLQNVQNVCYIVAVLVMCALSSAFFAVLIPFLGAIFYYIYSLFRKTSRELKRFDGVTRSPVYSSFGEMLNGISTIRAYGREKFFFTKFCETADENFRYFFTFYSAGRWLALRLDLVSVAVILFVSLIAVFITDYGGSVNENMLGLALVYALQLTGMLQWTVRVTIETENNMTAAERLLSFNNIASEAERVLPTDPASDVWPSRGHISIKNLSMRYRPGLEKVISGVTLDIPGGCKVGVCGRTGAGKSSLMLALFRIVEPELGSEITLDGVDILSMGLDRLRTQLTIIPQDPVMFSGSLRYNLDPFSKYSDLEIWMALERAHLKEDIIQKFPLKLDHIVSERGENISVGQKQLLCIARALLRRPKVIIMDEATASVDSATDKRIQHTIREAFKDCTILTIAHRLETIADYDRIVVMNEGHVAEYASPYELLQQRDGLFRALIDQLGPELRASFEKTARRRQGLD